MCPIQVSSETSPRTTTCTSRNTRLNAHIHNRDLLRLTRLNQTLALFPAMFITLTDAHETLGMNIRRVGFVHANGNRTDKMDADVELAFEPAIFRPLRSVFEVNDRNHDNLHWDGIGLAHLRIEEAKSEGGDDDGSKVRPFMNSNNKQQHEQHVLHNKYQTPATSRLRKVSDASCSCSKSPYNVSTVNLNANKHSGDNGKQHQPANKDQLEASPNPPPLCSCTTKSSTKFTFDSSETNASSYRTAAISALKEERLSIMALSLNDDLTTPAKDYDAWITGTEKPAPIQSMTTAPLFLPDAPPIFRTNPGQILLRHASSLCQRIENVVESESTRSFVSIGNLGLSEESRYYQYPWKVQAVYVDNADFPNGNARANTIATVLVGAGGMDDTIYIAELRAAVGGLLWGYEHSNKGEGYYAAKPISVLVLSYFGSGHGRIMQVHHNGRNLVVQHSPLMTFDMGDYRAESAFIRYTSGRPFAV
ncbi:hypothetical protein BDW68DRAFT_177164 [Aspergillus falconensis]